MAQEINKEELKNNVNSAKEEVKAAKEELRGFEKEHGLEKDGDHSGHEKLGKKWTKLSNAVAKKQEALDNAKAALSGEKAEKPARAVKYEYPTVTGEDGKEREMTAKEKKQYRTKARTEKAKTEKGEAPAAPKKEKKSKVAVEDAAPAPEASEKKSKKKEKKEAAPVED